MTTTIRTNHHTRPVLSRFELTETESAEFDYLNADEGSFFRFKGNVYDLGEFSRITAPGSARNHPMECQNPDLQGWDGYIAESSFFGLLIKYADEFESVIVGQYFS